jgi:hypothetical protein
MSTTWLCFALLVTNGGSIPIAEWLESVNPDLSKYAEQLAEYGFTNSALLAASDLADIESDLKELKVKSAHRRLILKGLKGTCAENPSGGGWDPSHDPILDEGMDRCNIERVPEADMTYKRFNAEYWWKHPVIILRDNPNTKAVAATTKEALLRDRGNRKIGITTLESYPFRGEKRTTVRDLLLNTFEQPMDASGEFASDNSALAADIRFSFRDDLGIGALYKDMPLVKKVLKKNRGLQTKYQLAMSPGKDIGLGFHCHSDVFAETLHGTRRWFLASGNSTPPGGFNPRRTSASWIHETYITLGDDVAAREGLYECILRPSELLYVPSGWFHSTVGLGQAVGLSRFTIGSVEEPYFYMRQLYSGANECSNVWYQPGDVRSCKDCVQLASQFIEENPNGFLQYNARALCRMVLLRRKNKRPSKKQRKKAVAEKIMPDLEKCIELNPHYAPCHTWMGRAHKVSGRSRCSK